MKTIARFVAILTACLAVSVVCWDVLVKGNLYYCTDEVGFDFLSPGDWVHGDVATVSKINTEVTMSEPDQILTGWSVDRLWGLWAGIIGASLLASCAGCWVGRSLSRRSAQHTNQQAEQGVSGQPATRRE